MKPEAQLAELKRGVVDLHVESEFLERLSAGKPLKIKAGFDPTRPDLHLGHTVLLNKMRQFQELGHDVVFIVGDFTAQIGDPSGRSSTRPVPTRDEILEGARTYAEQAFKILDQDRTQIVYNGEWLGKMAFDDVIRLAGKYTLARMMERDDFRRRWAEHQSISIHELLYPLAQAYDSVVLECDVELGGTDQLFNLLVGREIMREMGQRPQIVMTTPILEGINARSEGGKIVGAKMSKSLDNYVGVVSLVRVMNGSMPKGGKITVMSTGAAYNADRVGSYTPKMKDKEELRTGEVGFVIAGIKDIFGAPVVASGTPPGADSGMSKCA